MLCFEHETPPPIFNSFFFISKQVIHIVKMSHYNQSLGPSLGGAFLDLFMFRGLLVLVVLVVLVVKIGETVSADDSSLLIYD